MVQRRLGKRTYVGDFRRRGNHDDLGLGVRAEFGLNVIHNLFEEVFVAHKLKCSSCRVSVPQIARRNVFLVLTYEWPSHQQHLGSFFLNDCQNVFKGFVRQLVVSRVRTADNCHLYSLVSNVFVKTLQLRLSKNGLVDWCCLGFPNPVDIELL